MDNSDKTQEANLKSGFIFTEINIDIVKKEEKDEDYNENYDNLVTLDDVTFIKEELDDDEDVKNFDEQDDFIKTEVTEEPQIEINDLELEDFDKTENLVDPLEVNVHIKDEPINPFHNVIRPSICQSLKRNQTLQHPVHTEKKYECKICHQSFQYSWNLKQHELTHDKIRKAYYFCRKCTVVFDSKNSFEEHILKHPNYKLEDSDKKYHTENRLYKCGQCDKTFRWKSNLSTHISFQHSTFCELCQKTFRNKDCLRAHRYLIHIKGRPHVCNICQKAFRTKAKLHLHSVVHISNKPFECDICHKFYASKEYLSRHKNIHKLQDKFYCTLCDQVCISKASLNKHLLTHTAPSVNVCETCNKAFNSESELKLHLPIHTTENLYACKSCNETFDTKISLNKHQLIHSTKTFSCSTCNFLFISKQDLFQHMTIAHYNKKKYRCEICVHDRLFRNKASYENHLRIHTGEKKYICDVCNKGFIQKINLVEHKMTHTGIKPFACEFCGHTFRNRYAVNLHIKAQHMNSKVAEGSDKIENTSME